MDPLVTVLGKPSKIRNQVLSSIFTYHGISNCAAFVSSEAEIPPSTRAVVTLGYKAYQAYSKAPPAVFPKDMDTLSWIPDGPSITPSWDPWYIYQTAPDRLTDLVFDIETAYWAALQDPKQISADVSFQTIEEPKDVTALHEKLLLNTSMLYACDIETTGFDPYKDEILCIGVGLSATEAVVIAGEALQAPEVATLFSDPKISWIFHNGKFDVRFLLHKYKVQPKIAADTLLLSYVLDERGGKHGLKYLIRTRLGLGDYEQELRSYLKKKSDSFALVPPPVLHKYLSLDVCYTTRLHEYLLWRLARAESSNEAGITKLYLWLVSVENSLIEVEDNGLLVDREILDSTAAEFGSELDQLEKSLQQLTKNNSFNPRSFKQVAHWLYDVFHLPEVTLFRNNRPRSTAREALDKHAEALELQQLTDSTVSKALVFIKTLIQYRELKKIQSTYVLPMYDKLQGDGRVHTDFMLHGSVTGRLASSRPNLMNIPRATKNQYAKRIRGMFVASPGNVLISADYSQAEMRVLATLSQDPFLLNAYRKGLDLHTETTIMLFGENWVKEDRMIAKMLNFGLVYGRTANSIAVERQIDLAEAERLMQEFFERMPEVSDWIGRIRQQAVTQGFLTTRMHRFRRFGLVTHVNQAVVANQAANFPIQSTSSDICLTALLNAHNWLKETGLGKALLMVHDSIIVECAKSDAEQVSEKLSELMQNASKQVLGESLVPFKVDVSTATNWGSL